MEVLRRADTRIALRKVLDPMTTATGTYNFSDGRAVKLLITIDPAKGGLVEAALHEALHVLFAESGFPANDAIEEVLVHALERELWVKMVKGKEMAKWRRTVERKIKAEAE